MSAAIDPYRNLIWFLCGLDLGSLEDLPVMPVDVNKLHDGLARPGCEQ